MPREAWWKQSRYKKSSQGTSKAYLKPSQTSTIERFGENI